MSITTLSRRELGIGAAAISLAACTGTTTRADDMSAKKELTMTDNAITDTAWANMSEADWQARLTDLEFHVLRKEGTERPGTSPLNAEKGEGTFVCAGCALPLFKSETKYESGTGLSLIHI